MLNVSFTFGVGWGLNKASQGSIYINKHFFFKKKKKKTIGWSGCEVWRGVPDIVGCRCEKKWKWNLLFISVGVGWIS